MIQTMLGEMCGTCKVEEHGKYHKSYLINGDCGKFWVSEREFKRIKLPFLGTKERKMYGEIVDKPLKIEMFRCENGERYIFDTKNDQKVIEAIVKGGYNY